MGLSIRCVLGAAACALVPAAGSAINLDLTEPTLSVADSSVYSHFEPIGDIDEDGTGDFFVPATGSIRVLSGADGSEIYRIEDRFIGTASTVTDDLNGDGVPEIFAAADGYLALFDGISGEELHRANEARLYAYSRSIGDVTGDGFGDIVLVEALVSAGGNVGSILYLVDGATLGRLRTFRGTARSDFGVDVAGIPDVDGDGVDDFAVAAGPPPSGGTPEIFIYSGATQSLMRVIPQQTQDPILFVRRIVPAGDFDGDGMNDIAISGDRSGTVDSAVEVYSMVDGSLIRRFSFDGFRMTFGLAFGSLDADHVPDLAVGLAAPENVDVKVVSGANGFELRRFTQNSSEFFPIGGISTADFNGDGLEDLLVSRYENSFTTGYRLTSQSVANVAQELFLSGGWFDPAPEHSNEGVFLEFAEHPESGNPAITAIWYGYAQDGSQKWYIGGPSELSDEGQARFEMFSANGAQFGDAFESASVQRTAEGDAIIHIGGCNAIDFRMYFESGDNEELQLIPLLRTNLELDCADTATSASAFNPTGIWWNANRAGEGFFIDTVDSDMGTYTFSSWFAYADGQPAWVVAGDFVEANDGNTALPAFTSARNTEYTSLIPFGELRFDIASCTTATATYASIDESAVGTQSGTIELTGDFTGDTFGGCPTP